MFIELTSSAEAVWVQEVSDPSRAQGWSCLCDLATSACQLCPHNGMPSGFQGMAIGPSYPDVTMSTGQRILCPLSLFEWSNLLQMPGWQTCSPCIGQNWTKCLIPNQWQARGLKAGWSGMVVGKTHSSDKTEELIKPMMLICLLQCWLNCHY